MGSVYNWCNHMAMTPHRSGYKPHHQDISRPYMFLSSRTPVGLYASWTLKHTETEWEVQWSTNTPGNRIKIVSLCIHPLYCPFFSVKLRKYKKETAKDYFGWTTKEWPCVLDDDQILWRLEFLEYWPITMQSVWSTHPLAFVIMMIRNL